MAEAATMNDLRWTAPSRPYQKRNKEFYLTAFLLAFLLIVIAFFMKEWLLIGSVLAVVFVSYALAAVPPEDVEYKLSSRGVWIAGTFYKFSELSEFWFETQLKTTVLIFRLRKTGKKIYMLVPPEKKAEVVKRLKGTVPQPVKPLKSLVDVLGEWISKRIPLDEK